MGRDSGFIAFLAMLFYSLGAVLVALYSISPFGSDVYFSPGASSGIDLSLVPAVLAVLSAVVLLGFAFRRMYGR